MQTVEISLELVNVILGYLGSRPYVETAGLIQKIQAEAGPQVPQAPQEEEAPSE